MKWSGPLFKLKIPAEVQIGQNASGWPAKIACDILNFESSSWILWMCACFGERVC